MSALRPRGIVLAAGASSRMGALKPLLDVDGAPAVLRAAKAFSDIAVAPLVVVGHRAEAVIDALRPVGLEWVVNEGHARGMYSSVRIGLEAAGREAGPVGILPGDCCLVRGETIGRVAREMAMAAADVAYPVRLGQRGHPPLLSSAAGVRLPASDPPGGLEEALAGVHAALDVPVEDGAVLLDMDRPEDYERILEAARRERVPDADECVRLLERRGVSGGVRAHSEMVARVCVVLGRALSRAGAYLNLDLLRAAALLHDVARAEPDHAAAGATWLDEQGYPRLAAVVAPHMDVPAPMRPLPDETGVLFLADKLVSGDRLVTLDERSAATMERFADDPRAAASARRRLAAAAEIATACERLTGAPLQRTLGALASAQGPVSG